MKNLISKNVVIIIQKCQEIYGNTIETLVNNGNIVNFPGNSASFKLKVKVTEKKPAAGNTKDAKIAVPLKYLGNFWRTLEIS